MEPWSITSEVARMTVPIDVEIWWGSASTDADEAVAVAPESEIYRSMQYSDTERRAQFLVGRAIVRARFARITGGVPRISLFAPNARGAGLVMENRHRLSGCRSSLYRTLAIRWPSLSAYREQLD